MSDPLDELLRRGDPAKNARALDADRRLERVFARPISRKAGAFRTALFAAVPILSLAIGVAVNCVESVSEPGTALARRATPEPSASSPPTIRVAAESVHPFAPVAVRSRKAVRRAKRRRRLEPRLAFAIHVRRRLTVRPGRVSPETVERVVIDHEDASSNSGPVVAVTMFGSGENVNIISTSAKESTL